MSLRMSSFPEAPPGRLANSALHNNCHLLLPSSPGPNACPRKPRAAAKWSTTPHHAVWPSCTDFTSHKSPSFCLSVSLSACLSLALCVSLCVCVCLSLSVSVCLSLCLSLSVSLSLSDFVALSLTHSRSLSVSVSLSLSVSVCLSLSPLLLLTPRPPSHPPHAKSISLERGSRSFPGPHRPAVLCPRLVSTIDRTRPSSRARRHPVQTLG